MIIKGQEVNLSGAQLIRALLNDEFGYKHICSCGKEQTYAGCKTMLKVAAEKAAEIDHDFICSDCRKRRPCRIWGVTYSSVKEAAEKTYDPDKCQCTQCHKVFTPKQWYQWCQRYLQHQDLAGRPLLCHSCMSSVIRTELNERDHELLSQQTRERNLKNWKDPEYRQKMTDQATDYFNKFMKEQSSLLATEETLNVTNGILSSLPNILTRLTTDTTEEFDIQRGRYVFSRLKSSTNDLTKTVAQLYDEILNSIDLSFDKYLARYNTPFYQSEEDANFYQNIKTILDSHHIKNQLYLNFISRFSRQNGNHHILLRSIEENSYGFIRVNPIEHMQAHFFLMLDNFTHRLGCNMCQENNYKVSIIQLKIFIAFAFMAHKTAVGITDLELLSDINRIVKIQ